MKNMDDKEIIQAQDRIITELTGVIKCMAEDPPCVKMIQEALEEINEARNTDRP